MSAKQQNEAARLVEWKSRPVAGRVSHGHFGDLEIDLYWGHGAPRTRKHQPWYVTIKSPDGSIRAANGHGRDQATAKRLAFEELEYQLQKINEKK